ncbi:MAG: cation diffusion facilitator family transporter [Allorhizobium sp.]
MSLLGNALDWFGLRGHEQAGHGHSHDEAGGHGHTHGVIDPTLTTTAKGIWAIKWSFVILAITAVFQLFVVYISGSVALLADTIHNVGDAVTAVPLWIAFVLARRKPSQTFTYGLGRAEDLAGIVIVAIILLSAIVAGYVAIDRLINPQPVTELGWLTVAGIIGFIGNEAVAVFRIRVGRQMNSAALIADGYHARTDGLTSLAVVFGALGVWLGFPLADPIIGLLITVTIFVIVWQSARAVFTRTLDGVEPSVTTEIRHAAEHVQGVVSVIDAKARWMGHQLHSDVVIQIDEKLALSEANTIANGVRQELHAHLPALRTVNIIFAPELEPIATPVPTQGHHHAPDPFRFDGEFAKGVLEIIDTADGERMRLSLSSAVDGLRATVSIDRLEGKFEILSFETVTTDPHVLLSVQTPAEPHEFTADLQLALADRQQKLVFEMVEPAGHHH